MSAPRKQRHILFFVHCGFIRRIILESITELPFCLAVLFPKTGIMHICYCLGLSCWMEMFVFALQFIPIKCGSWTKKGTNLDSVTDVCTLTYTDDCVCSFVSLEETLVWLVVYCSNIQVYLHWKIIIITAIKMYIQFFCIAESHHLTFLIL